MTMRLRAVITEYQSAMKRAAGDTAAMSKSAQGSFTELNKKVGELGSELTRKVSLPLVATGAGALKLASDFDTSFAQMVGLAGVAGDEVAGLREEVLNLSKGTAVGPQKLAEALYFIRSAGIDAAHAMDVLDASAKASAAGLGEPAVIARTLSAAINAYGASNLSAAKATDILVAGIRAATFEPDQLAASLGTVIATASTMGITFDQLVGTLAVLSRTGLDAAEATTSLNAILTMLSNGGAASEQLLASHGLSLQKLRDIAAGPGGVIEAMRLLDKTFGDDQEALSTIIPNVRAFRGAMTLLAQDGSIVDQVMQDVGDSAGSLDEAFAAVKDTWAFKLKQGIVEVQVALVRLGELLGPLAAVFGTTIGGIAAAFGKLPVGIQQVVVSLLAVAAAAGPLMRVFGSLAGPAVDAIKGITRAVQTMRLQLALAQMDGLSTGQAFRQMAAGLIAPTIAVGALAVVMVGAIAIYKDYAKQKQQAAERTRDFVAALKEERDAQGKPAPPPGTPTPVNAEAFKQIFGETAAGGAKFGEVLRKSGADMTYFAQAITDGGSSLKHFGDLANNRDVVRWLRDAANEGDVTAQKLLELRAATDLSDGQFSDLLARLGGIAGSFGSATREVQNETYAMQQAAGAAGDLRGQQAGLDAAVSDFSGTMSESAKATLESALAAAQQARAWDIANQSAAGLAQGVANLLDMLGALFGATFDVGKAEQGFADSVADVDGAMRTGGGSTRDYAKEQRSLEDATKDVTKAQKELADAEAALVEARKGPSAREKSDAALDVREATLAVKEATKAQSDARKKLLEEKKKGKEGDVAGAQLDVERSAISLKRAQDRLTDSQKAQNTVLHSGEEQSQDVKTALDDLEQAQERVADATQRQMDAEATLRGDGAGGGPVADRARTLRGAYDNLTTSGQNWITKLIESGAPTSTVITALDTQREAVRKLIEKYGDANGELEKYLGWLKEIERQVRLQDPNDPAAFGQGGADASGVSYNKDGYPIRADGSNLFGGRASGGLVAPFETYEMGEAGPEALTVGTTKPPDKLGKGRAAAEMSGRSALGARTFMVGLDGPQLVTMGPEPGWVTPNNKLGDVAGARASGGPVLPGRTYLVGERGPEILTVGGFESTQQMLERRTTSDRSDSVQRLVERATLRERFTERVRAVLQAIRDRATASTATDSTATSTESASDSTTATSATSSTDRSAETATSERATDATSTTERTTSDNTSSSSTDRTDSLIAERTADSMLRDSTSLQSSDSMSVSDAQTVRDRENSKESATSNRTATSDTSTAERASDTSATASESTTSAAETMRAEIASDSRTTATALTDLTSTAERTADTERSDFERADSVLRDATTLISESFDKATASSDVTSAQSQTVRDRQTTSDTQRSKSVSDTSDVSSAVSKLATDRSNNETQRSVDSQTAAPSPTLPATPLYLRVSNAIQQMAQQLGLPPIDLGLEQGASDGTYRMTADGPVLLVPRPYGNEAQGGTETTQAPGAATGPYRMTEQGPVYLMPSSSGAAGMPGAPGANGGAGGRGEAGARSSTSSMFATATHSALSSIGAPTTYEVGLNGPEVITMGSQPGWVHSDVRELEGRANGGPVAAGQTVVVGENGPEIITVGGMVTSRHSATSDRRIVDRNASSVNSYRSSESSTDMRSSSTRESDRERLAPAMEQRRVEQFAGVAAAPQEAQPAPWSQPMMAASSLTAPVPISLEVTVAVEGDTVKVANNLIRLSKQNGGLPIRIRSGN